MFDVSSLGIMVVDMVARSLRELPDKGWLVLVDRMELHIAGSFLMPKFDGQPTANVLKWAREADLTTSLDTAWDSRGGWLATIEPCLPYIDIFMPSFEEAKMIASRDEPGDLADFFLSYGIEMVALKMGEKGCFVRTAGEEISFACGVL